MIDREKNYIAVKYTGGFVKDEKTMRFRNKRRQNDVFGEKNVPLSAAVLSEWMHFAVVCSISRKVLAFL